MTPEQFNQLASENYNRIPLVREVLADLETPLSAYMKLANTPYSYLFESVQGGEKWGRYSIIGLASNTILRVYDDQLAIEKDGNIIEDKKTNDPLKDIEEFQKQFRVPDIEGIPLFSGGLVGYFGYETIGYIEPRLQSTAKDDPIGNPDILLMVSEEMFSSPLKIIPKTFNFFCFKSSKVIKV